MYSYVFSKNFQKIKKMSLSLCIYLFYNEDAMLFYKDLWEGNVWDTIIIFNPLYPSLMRYYI